MSVLYRTSTVFDSSNRPVAGALVEVRDEAGELVAIAAGNPQVTTADGVWTSDLAEGIYTIRISKGPASITRELEVPAPSSGVDVVSEIVYDHHGNRVAGAVVTIYYDGTAVAFATTTTNENGVWSQELEGGNYTIIITAAGRHITRRITVFGNFYDGPDLQWLLNENPLVEIFGRADPFAAVSPATAAIVTYDGRSGLAGYTSDASKTSRFSFSQASLPAGADSSGSQTIAFWLWRGEEPGETNGSYFYRINPSPAAFDSTYLVNLGYDGYFEFNTYGWISTPVDHLNIGTSGVSLTPSYPSAGAWHQYVLRVDLPAAVDHDAIYLSLFVDGVLMHSKTYNEVGYVNPAWLAANIFNVIDLASAVDAMATPRDAISDYRVWFRALTDEEIAALHPESDLRVRFDQVPPSQYIPLLFQEL